MAEGNSLEMRLLLSLPSAEFPALVCMARGQDQEGTVPTAVPLKAAAALDPADNLHLGMDTQKGNSKMGSCCMPIIKGIIE